VLTGLGQVHRAARHPRRRTGWPRRRPRSAGWRRRCLMASASPPPSRRRRTAPGCRRRAAVPATISTRSSRPPHG